MLYILNMLIQAAHVRAIEFPYRYQFATKSAVLSNFLEIRYCD